MSETVAPAALASSGAPANEAPRQRLTAPVPSGALLPILIVGAWVVASRIPLLPAALLPSPVLVLSTLRDMTVDGSLARDLAATGWRLLAGFGLGASTGIALGAVVGALPAIKRLLDPTIQALRSVPSIAWVPLFILWFGIFDLSKILLIAVGVFFPVYLNSAAAVAGTDRKLLEVGRVSGLRVVARLCRIQLPASLPGIVIGLRGGLGLGWMFVAAAELMGASEGLGFELMDGDQTGRPERVLAALLVFAVCGKTTDLALSLLFRPLVSWQDTEKPR